MKLVSSSIWIIKYSDAMNVFLHAKIFFTHMKKIMPILDKFKNTL